MPKLALLPTLPVIILTGTDATEYNFNPFENEFDFRLQALQCQPPVDSQGGTFTANIVSSDGANDSMNSLLDNLEEGNEITIYIGKSNDGLKKVFTGMIREINAIEPNKNLIQVSITGPDWWSDIAKNRICSFARIQQIGADGISYDQTDANAAVGQIATDLMSLASSYSVPDVTVIDQGIIIDSANIDPSLLGTTGIKVPQFISNYEKLDDKLSELDVWGNSIHYFDPDGNFYMRPAAIVPTSEGSWLFTDSKTDPLITNWGNGQVGYIAPGCTRTKTVLSYKYRLIGTGGNQASIDQKQETNSDHTQLSGTWLAMKFQPQFINAFTIQLYLQSFYAIAPTEDVTVIVVQDKGGTPTGQQIASVTINRGDISTAGGWVSINIGQQYQTSTPYWIILPGNTGYDGTNGYNWYKGGSTSTTATSSDGVSWSASSGVAGYMFRALTSVPIRVIMPGFSASPTTKVFHEDVYQQPYITDVNALRAYLLQLNKLTNFRKEIFKCRIYSPDIVPMPFSSVLLSKIASGIAYTSGMDFFVLGQVTFNFQGGTQEATGTYWISCQLVRFTQFP